jgi:hypothetical protein
MSPEDVAIFSIAVGWKMLQGDPIINGFLDA